MSLSPPPLQLGAADVDAEARAELLAHGVPIVPVDELYAPNGVLDFYGAGDGRLHANGKVFYLRGINWYGAEGKGMMPEGMDVRRMSDLLDLIADQGFNSIRLTFNMEDWIADPLIPQDGFDHDLNPELVDVTYREMLRLVVRKAGRRQLLVLLACHRLRRSYADSEHPGDWPGSWNGLWWEDAVVSGVRLTEQNVAALWGEIAQLFCAEWNLFATDLMNEPHMGYWGSDAFGVDEDGVEWSSKHMDWAVGASALGNAVLRACPRLLIFVEGTAELKTEWGESFKTARLNGLMEKGLVALSNMSKLVLSPHSYGPSLYQVPETLKWFPKRFQSDNYPSNLVHYWEDNYGFATSMGPRLPMVLGEAGGDMVCCDIKGVYQRPAADAEYLARLISYVGQKGIGLFYFCLNPGAHDTGGILQRDWRTLVHSKARMLAGVRSTRVRRAAAPPPPPPRRPHRHPSPPALALAPPLAPCGTAGVRCPPGYFLCAPTFVRRHAFCDVDADCEGNRHCSPASAEAEAACADEERECCVVSPFCPAEYHFCDANARQPRPFCDIDADCYGDSFCPMGEDTAACEAGEGDCCLRNPHGSCPIGYTLCAPTDAHAEEFCDADADCAADFECTPTASCPLGKGECCVKSPRCPAEYFYCPPTEARPHAICDIDHDCVGDDFCPAAPPEVCSGRGGCCTLPVFDMLRDVDCSPPPPLPPIPPPSPIVPLAPSPPPPPFMPLEQYHPSCNACHSINNGPGDCSAIMGCHHDRCAFCTNQNPSPPPDSPPSAAERPLAPSPHPPPPLLSFPSGLMAHQDDARRQEANSPLDGLRAVALEMTSMPMYAFISLAALLMLAMYKATLCWEHRRRSRRGVQWGTAARVKRSDLTQGGTRPSCFRGLAYLRAADADKEAEQNLCSL
ncbi:hypothetical protein AB1Y20_018740 [Prymnesium parvum]|uniref:Glycoside hydrolase family 5 domain-containing protein n=1 Tax=Prymnesium parvum TaxID=97485 RepID=A0AB34JPF4_PRYPA